MYKRQQVSVPATVPLKDYDYNAEVELINPVADTVANANYRGADVDWYVKADDIVLKNKGNQNAGNPQTVSYTHLGKSTPQGTASLEGAEFTWSYYDGYYNADNLPAKATRTWTTKTVAEKDSDGTIHYVSRLADSYKVSGDSFYTCLLYTSQSLPKDIKLRMPVR